MFGVGIGILNVYIQEDYNRRKNKLILMWSDYGNQGNTWIMSQAPIFSNVPYRVRKYFIKKQKFAIVQMLESILSIIMDLILYLNFILLI